MVRLVGSMKRGCGGGKNKGRALLLSPALFSVMKSPVIMFCARRACRGLRSRTAYLKDVTHGRGLTAERRNERLCQFKIFHAFSFANSALSALSSLFFS